MRKAEQGAEQGDIIINRARGAAGFISPRGVPVICLPVQQLVAVVQNVAVADRRKWCVFIDNEFQRVELRAGFAQGVSRQFSLFYRQPQIAEFTQRSD